MVASSDADLLALASRRTVSASDIHASATQVIKLTCSRHQRTVVKLITLSLHQEHELVVGQCWVLRAVLVGAPLYTVSAR